MRAAVTGGTGIVGSAVVKHLVGARHGVRALARSRRSSRWLDSVGAIPVSGDVLDPPSLRPLVEGADVVFHVAGVNMLCPSDPALMWRVNVEGTRAVVDACRSSGVGRLVHTSSAVTIGEEEGTVGTEYSPHRGFFLSEYERSKHDAERALFSEANGLDVVSVNPSSVQGPGRATGTGRLLLAAAAGRLPVAFETSFSLVDIDDCARGHLLAAERGAPGERYLLSGAVLETHEAMRLLSVATGHKLSPWYLTPRAVRGLAALTEDVCRLVGREAPMCREAARVMLHGHRYDGSRATRDLDLAYTPVTDTIRRTLDWFVARGLLRTRR